MNWIDRILRRLIRHKAITNAAGSVFMIRYKLLLLPFFNVYLHHILRSDEDPELHDHPWHFVSLVLWRGYVEVLKSGPRMIRAGSVVRHRATDCHRLVLGQPAWTLVFVSGRAREWGFHTERGWVPSADFFDTKFGAGKWTTK